MASADWHGKYKGKMSAKAQIRHNDKEQRLAFEHGNKDIDKTLTQDNYSYYGLTYKQKCNKFDKRIEIVSEGVRMSSGKNANTMLQVIVVYPPNGMPVEEQRKWFMRIGDIARDSWGDNFIDLDVHVDELHEYNVAGKKDKVMSKVHGHLQVVPVDEQGKLNGKEFSKRWRIQRFNDIVHEMTATEFDLQWNDGTGKHKRKTVEQLKSESEKLAVEQGANDIINNLKQEREKFEKDRQEYEISVQEYEAELDDEERELDQREEKLDQREQKLETEVTEWQKIISNREDIDWKRKKELDMREKAIAERERRVSQRENNINELEIALNKQVEVMEILKSPDKIIKSYLRKKNLELDFNNYVQQLRNSVNRNAGAASRVLEEANWIQSQNGKSSTQYY